MMSAQHTINELKLLGKFLDKEMPEITEAMSRSHVTPSERKAVQDDIARMQEDVKELKAELESLFKNVIEIKEDFQTAAADYNARMAATSKYVDTVVGHLKEYGFQEDQEDSQKKKEDVKHEVEAKEPTAESQCNGKAPYSDEMPDEPVEDETVRAVINNTILAASQRKNRGHADQNGFSKLERVDAPRTTQIVTPAPVKETTTYEEVTPGLWVKTSSRERAKICAEPEAPLSFTNSPVNGFYGTKRLKEGVAGSMPEDNMASPQLDGDTMNEMNKLFASKSASIHEAFKGIGIPADMPEMDPPDLKSPDCAVDLPTIVVHSPSEATMYSDDVLPPSPQMSETVAQMMEEFQRTGKITMF